MTMDAVTEKIAHFIGAFEMMEQEARLRMEYDIIRATKAAEDEAKILDLDSFRGKQKHALEDVDPKLKLDAVPQPSAKSDALASTAAQTEAVTVEASAIPDRAGDVITPSSQTISDAPDTPDTTVTFTISPPGSVASVVYQLSWLSDNDTFGNVFHAGFQTVEQLFVAFEAILEIVSDLSPIQIDLLPTSGNWMMAVKNIQNAASDIEISASGALQNTVLQGQSAYSIYVNGEEVVELTSIDDMLPDFFARKLDAQAGEDDGTHDFGRDFEGRDAPSDDNDGPTVVTGANSAVNTASVTFNWLDAKVIAVAGDVVRFDAISQVNVLIDHDRVPDAVSDADLQDQASQVVNAASIAVTPTNGPAAPGGTAKMSTPDNWVVVRHEGDVTQLNWVQQHTFLTDFDRAEVSLTGSTIMLGMGENDIANAYDFDAFGYQYDLILIGGDLIDINMVNQMNVLLDSDDLAVIEPDAGTAPTAAAIAPPVTDGAAQDGVSFNKDDVSGVKESAPITDDDDPEGIVEEPSVPLDDPVPFSTGDNLLYNQASINTIGADTDQAINSVFSDVLSDFQAGGNTVDDAVLDDAHFDGTELLRVLYIDGDFTSVNLLDQINVVGDADQVHLARDDFAAALQQEIQVTTGSNLLANMAAIQENGIDSTVMAEGETYSDALIHQANLIDTDIDTSQTPLSDLATEAVAFLADGLMSDGFGDDIAAQTQNMIFDTMAQTDGMQSVLA